MSKIENLTVNFTESDIQEMLAHLQDDGTQMDVFEWSLKTDEGTKIALTITVGDDEY